MAIEVTDVPYSGVYGTKRTPKQELGKDDFLMLLTKQMQNQDPMEPMDNMEFVSQMAQFTSLEQMTNMNTSFNKFLDNFGNNYKLQAMSMLGWHVTAKLGATGEAVEGSVMSVRFEDGDAVFSVGESGQTVKLDEIVSINGIES
jgi:flagellar basal-body rod modification protein FlgD